MINYTTPNFILTQGDYEVAWLSIDGSDKNINIENSLVLPSKDDIPRFIPNDAIMTRRESYFEGTKLFFRWAFVFDGYGDHIIWYQNAKIYQEKQRQIQEYYVKKGAWMGFWLSLIVAIFVIVFERLFFDWLPFGNRFSVYLIRKFRFNYLIGNLRNKKYHTYYCPHIDNFEYKKIFRNRIDASRENYRPCGTCHPDRL